MSKHALEEILCATFKAQGLPDAERAAKLGADVLLKRNVVKPAAADLAARDREIYEMSVYLTYEQIATRKGITLRRVQQIVHDQTVIAQALARMVA